MASSLTVGALLLAGIIPLTVSGAAATAPGPHGVLGAGAGAVPGMYMVKVKDGASLRAQGLPAFSSSVMGRHRGKIHQVLDKMSQSFSVEMSADEAEKVAADSDVEYVQQQRTYSINDDEPAPPSWGLDRIDQRATVVSNSYGFDPTSQGQGVHAYVIDTGVRITHPDFQGRGTLGLNGIDGSMNSDDCNGHGSHVAGTLGGAQYGVAKKVNIVAVKVFDCSGSGNDPAIVSGIDWVTANAIKPAVINMSLGSICTTGGFPSACPAGSSQGIIDAEARAVAAGITIVTAAGNDNADACFNVVGANASTINTGSTDQGDTKRGTSNWGGCVDIWAPGGLIVSVGGVGRHNPSTGLYDATQPLDPDPRTLSGTSMAAPHVAGAAAVLLSTPQFAKATPAQISAELDARSTVGVITGFNAGDTLSPNKLLYSRPSLPGSSVALASRPDGKLMILGTDNGRSMYADIQTAANSTTWNPNPFKSFTTGWESVAEDFNQNTNVGLGGLTTTGQIWQRQHSSVAAGSPDTILWRGLNQLNGLATSVAIARNSPSGRLEMFVANKQGQVFFASQKIANSKEWEGFQPINFPGAAAMSVAAETDSTGHIVLFIADKHGTVWQTSQTTPDGNTWSPITVMTDQGRLMNDIAVARNANGSLALVGTDGAGNVWHRAQTSPSSATWSNWVGFQSKTLMHLAAETNLNGHVAVVGVDNHGSVWQSTQTTANTETYDNWTSISSLLLRP